MWYLVSHIGNMSNIRYCCQYQYLVLLPIKDSCVTSESNVVYYYYYNYDMLLMAW